MEPKPTMVIGFASVFGPLCGGMWLGGMILGGLLGYTFFMYLSTRPKEGL